MAMIIDGTKGQPGRQLRSFAPSTGRPEMNIAVKGVKHAAPGPYLGFALQPGQLLFPSPRQPEGRKGLARAP
jgi:hypothetical protein